MYQSRRAGLEPLHPGLVGMSGTVTRELAPRGVIRVGSETWTADSQDGTVIPVGESVNVSREDGLILTVTRSDRDNTY